MQCRANTAGVVRPAGQTRFTTGFPFSERTFMNATQTATRQVLTLWYQDQALRVVVDREVRFAVEDIRRIARAHDDRHAECARDPRWPKVTTDDNGERIETLGWSQALNLIDLGDLGSRDIQNFGEWFLTGVIEQLCEELSLTGTERIDTSSVQESSFFRKAVAAMGGPQAPPTQHLH